MQFYCRAVAACWGGGKAYVRPAWCIAQARLAAGGQSHENQSNSPYPSKYDVLLCGGVTVCKLADCITMAGKALVSPDGALYLGSLSRVVLDQHSLPQRDWLVAGLRSGNLFTRSSHQTRAAIR